MHSLLEAFTSGFKAMEEAKADEVEISEEPSQNFTSLAQGMANL